MRTVKFRLYLLEVLLVLSLFFALFALNIDKKYIVLTILFIFFILISLMLNKKKDKNISGKQVSIIMLIFAFIYLGVFYLLGLFHGFIKSKYPLSMTNLTKVIIPISLIIILSELIRKRFLSQNGEIRIKGKNYNASPVLVYMSMTLVDLVIYAGIYNLSNLNDFLTVIGFILFASLSNNLLYNYISLRFGSKPVIIFRLITCLYMYIIPFVPNVYTFMRTFLRMLSPFLIYIVLERTYSKSFYRDRKKSVWSSMILLTIVALIIMLVSCQFKYGIIVIGSDSMTGSINKGDVVFYERYDGEPIETGQIIMFNYNNIKTIHRVVDIKSMNGETRYTTKGDSNRKPDSGYRRNEDIDGVVKFKIKYIGLLTLWFRSLFEQ